MLNAKQALERAKKAAIILTAMGEGHAIEFHCGQKEWIDAEPVAVCVLEHPELYRIKAKFKVGDKVLLPKSASVFSTEADEYQVLEIINGSAIAYRIVTPKNGESPIKICQFDVITGKVFGHNSKRHFRKAIA